ncbi:MAG TPA: lipoyl(octanoyl) transferase LipB [Dehalococcoidia bacterium]|nr:lipoyl(octanoyl) transferase LipB [Dehalococcoidia bacterium]
MRQRCLIHRAGLVDYEAAWRQQHELLAAVQAGGQHQLLLLQHPPTFTLGRNGHDAHVLASEEMLLARGARLFRVDRGGDVTFHGPGQIVGYPILDLRRLWGTADIPQYVRLLERVISGTLEEYGIAAGCVPGRAGVWVGDEKIAAIGVRVSRGVTMHGFALNVDPDLSFFELIVPCGIADAGVTSMARLLGAPPPLDEVADRLARRFSDVFEVDLLAPAEAVL